MASTTRGTAWEWGNSWWFVGLPWILMAWIGFAIAGVRTGARKYFAYAAFYFVAIPLAFYLVGAGRLKGVPGLEVTFATLLLFGFVASVIHPWVARGEYLRRLDARLRGMEYPSHAALSAPNQAPRAPRPPTPTGADPFAVFGGRDVEPPVETTPRPAVHAAPPPSPFARPASPPPPPPVPGAEPAPPPSPFARPVPAPPPVPDGPAAPPPQQGRPVPPPPPVPGGRPMPPPPPVPGGSAAPPPPPPPKDGTPPPPPGGRLIDY